MQFSGGIRRPIGTEEFVPKEMDHCEIAFCMVMMNEVEILFASEPCIPLKSRTIDVIGPVENHVCIKRRSACARVNQEQFNREQKVRRRADQQHRNKEEGGYIVTAVATPPFH